MIFEKHICDTIKGNESHGEDFHTPTFLQLKNATDILMQTPLESDFKLQVMSNLSTLIAT